MWLKPQQANFLCSFFRNAVEKKLTVLKLHLCYIDYYRMDYLIVPHKKRDKICLLLKELFWRTSCFRQLRVFIDPSPSTVSPGTEAHCRPPWVFSPSWKRLSKSHITKWDKYFCENHWRHFKNKHRSFEKSYCANYWRQTQICNFSFQKQSSKKLRNLRARRPYGK